MARGSARSIATGLLLVLCVAPGGSRAEPPAVDARPSLEPAPVALRLVRPEDGERVASPVPWLQVEGRAVRGPSGPYDLVLGIDLSQSTLAASGFDVDGDGIVGGRRQLRGRSGWTWQSDAGDSILAAELLAAERLLRRLERDGGDVRAGVIRFASSSAVHVRLGPPERARKALTRLRVGRDGGGTNFAAALRRAERELKRSRSRGREAIFVLLSDGEATAPGSPHRAQKRARAALRKLVKREIRVHAFALGERGAQGPKLLEEFATRTSGRFHHVTRAGDVARRLPRLDTAEVAHVAIRNLTRAADARTVRWFDDGSFDAVVPLSEGSNRIEIRVRTRDGVELRELRRVEWRRQVAPVAAERFAAELRARRLHSELAARARRGPLRRSLEVVVDD